VTDLTKTVLVAEDLEIIARIQRRFGGVRFAEEIVVDVSARRFSLEIGGLYAGKCVVWAMLRFFGLRCSLFKYKWKGYPKDNGMVKGL
jgi:hypothetical protein